jgi:hypothetical protein
VGIAYGGYLGMRAEGTSLADVREQASSAFSGLAPVMSSDVPSAAESDVASEPPDITT